MSSISTQQLTTDLKAVINDAEALLKATAGEAGAQLGVLRGRLQESLTTARERLGELEDAVVAKSRAAAQATDEYVRENPWPSIGVVAALGLIAGIVIGSARR